MNTRTEIGCFIKAASLHAKDRDIVIRASADECAAIAARFGLLRLESFYVEGKAARWKKRGVSLSGRIRARLEQNCIATLEPVGEEIDAPFKAFFWPAEFAGELPDEGISGEVFTDIDSDDSPELYENDAINIGEAVLEYFALAINPYPKKSGSGSGIPAQKSDNAAVEASPFVVLKGLKNGGE